MTKSRTPETEAQNAIYLYEELEDALYHQGCAWDRDGFREEWVTEYAPPEENLKALKRLQSYADWEIAREGDPGEIDFLKKEIGRLKLLEKSSRYGLGILKRREIYRIRISELHGNSLTTDNARKYLTYTLPKGIEKETGITPRDVGVMILMDDDPWDFCMTGRPMLPGLIYEQALNPLEIKIDFETALGAKFRTNLLGENKIEVQIVGGEL
jgi:hypothetical protein